MTDKPVRKSRANGVQARENILAVALALFAEKGYAGASVRDIASGADANLAAIAYHFGDKAGLYRAAMEEPIRHAIADLAPFDAPGLPLDAAMRLYMRTCLRPLNMGKAALLSVQLRVREHFEPTGQLASPTESRDRAYLRLLDVLNRHFKLPEADAEVQALAFSIFALVAHLYYGMDHLRSVQPALLDGADAGAAWEDRYTAFAMSMIAAEQGRRHAAIPSASA